jgi:hypothetical protein
MKCPPDIPGNPMLGDLGLDKARKLECSRPAAQLNREWLALHFGRMPDHYRPPPGAACQMSDQSDEFKKQALECEHDEELGQRSRQIDLVAARAGLGFYKLAR